MLIELESNLRLGLREWDSLEPSLEDLSAQDSALSEESLCGLGPSTLGLADDSDFPCLATELEQQAKKLEQDWLCTSQPPAAEDEADDEQPGLPARAATAGVPSLRHVCLDQLAAMAQQVQPQEREQQWQLAAQQERQDQAHDAGGSGATLTVDAGEVCARDEPCTPQRYSKGDSSWSESPLPGSLEECAEVQSPAPANIMSLPSMPDPSAACCVSLVPAVACAPLHTLPPLPLAIHNAQRVRLGQQPTPGAWCGCGRSAWCNLPPCHAASCNVAAAVPGLLAYPPQDLFESGVNIEELCRVPEELFGALALDNESGDGGAACGSATSTGDGAHSAKRRRDGEPDGPVSPCLSGCGAGCASSDGAGEVMQEHASAAAATAAIKRLRTDACSPAALAAYSPMPLAAAAPGALQPSPAAVAAAAAEVAAAVCPRMVPVEVPTPVSVPSFAPPVPLPAAPRGGSAMSRNLGRPAGAPRLRPLPRVETPPAPPPVAPVAHTPSKPVTRQKNYSPAVGVVATRASVPRTSGRRTVMQWHTENVTDPRSGATVSEVQPGTFCTQCYALSTPVWRAGPFGVKTLCNACGVRWMKACKGSKK